LGLGLGLGLRLRLGLGLDLGLGLGNACRGRLLEGAQAPHAQHLRMGKHAIRDKTGECG